MSDGDGYKERRAALRVSNRVVTRPIPRLDSDVLVRKDGRGRKRKYTPLRMKNGINRYFEWCEEQDEVPSIKGMMIFLKMYKDAFYKYLKQPEFSDMLEHARLIISNWAEIDVYNTKGQAAGKIAYMKNIHGWSDKLETQSTNETRVVTVDEARAKIESLAPKLLELLGSQLTVNQIVHEAEIVEEGK